MSWVPVGAVDDFPVGRGTRVELGEHVVAVFRLADDFYAIGDRCSHAEASLSEGELWGTDVECPRHGSEFDLATGEPQSLPATSPVPTYGIKVEDGVVFLDVEVS